LWEGERWVSRFAGESSSKGGRIEGVIDRGKGSLCPEGRSWPQGREATALVYGEGGWAAALRETGLGFFLSIYRRKKIIFFFFFFQLLSKTSVFDFFSKISHINVASMRKINNFEHNALKVERVQKTLEI
jgi:hypothetical protein